MDIAPGYSQKALTASIAAKLSGLMLSFKYGMKQRYFNYLESLRPVMDDTLYRFYETLGEETLWKEK